MRKTILMVAALAALASTAVQAQDEPAATGAQGFGSESKAWLDLQASGSAASATERPLPGDIGSKVYQRYADSFAHPIPEKYERESFGSSTSGGGR